MRRQDKYPDTKIFRYLNLNPKGRITGDCTVRAIAKATSKTWEEVLKAMTETALKAGVFPSCNTCYDKVLNDYGFTKYKQPIRSDGTKLTTKEFIKTHPKGTYILHLAHHLTVIVDGVNYDIWDCTKTSLRVGVYYKKG